MGGFGAISSGNRLGFYLLTEALVTVSTPFGHSAHDAHIVEIQKLCGIASGAAQTERTVRELCKVQYSTDLEIIRFPDFAIGL